MGAVDPYSWMRDIQQLNSQEKALGQTSGMTPQVYERAIGANFTANQENQITQANIGLKNREIADREKQTNNQAIGMGVEGALTLGLNAPGFYKAGKDLKWWGQDPVAKGTALPTTSAANLPAAVDLSGQSLTSGKIAPASFEPGTDLSGYVTGAKDISGSTPAVESIAGQTASKEGISSISPASGGGVGLGALAADETAYQVGTHVVRGKFSPFAGIGLSTLSGYMMAGAGAGPVGAAAGAAVGLASMLFKF